MAPNAYTVNHFCNAYSLSRSMLYRLWSERLGPDCYQVGRRRYISAQAAETWQREREAYQSDQRMEGAS
ncbi:MULTISPECIES: hypothetical protein [Aurantimonas]|uniref:hypothetical protein n=1 Tax=Aurantimonas TaxID=182269 RepID=UPI003513ABE6